MLYYVLRDGIFMRHEVNRWGLGVVTVGDYLNVRDFKTENILQKNNLTMLYIGKAGPKKVNRDT